MSAQKDPKNNEKNQDHLKTILASLLIIVVAILGGYLNITKPANLLYILVAMIILIALCLFSLYLTDYTKKTNVIITAVVVVSLFCTAIGLSHTGGTPPSSTEPLIKIIDPTNGTNISQFYTVKGNYSNASSYNMYVVIESPDKSFFVQDEPAIHSNGTWDCHVQIGESWDTGKSFVIYALITTEKLGKDRYGRELPKYVTKDEVSVERM